MVYWLVLDMHLAAAASGDAPMQPTVLSSMHLLSLLSYLSSNGIAHVYSLSVMLGTNPVLNY